MKKRLCSLLLALALLVCVMPAVSAGLWDSTDVVSSADFRESVVVATGANISAFEKSYIGALTGEEALAGVSDWAKIETAAANALGFVPTTVSSGLQSPITRAEFAALAVETVHAISGMTNAEFFVPCTMCGEVSFTDASSVNVLTAAMLGIVNGYEDGSFRPNNSLTRQEAATMLTRMAELLGFDGYGAPISFIDTAGQWGADYIAKVSAMKNPYAAVSVMNGTGSGAFSPDDSYTREQAIVTMTRLAGAVIGDLSAYSGGAVVSLGQVASADRAVVETGSDDESIFNGGLVCAYNGWLFYSNLEDAGALYASKPDTGADVKLTDFAVCNINVTKNAVIFTDASGCFYYKSEGDAAVFSYPDDCSDLGGVIADCPDNAELMFGGVRYALSGMQSFWSDPMTGSLELTKYDSGEIYYYNMLLFDGMLIYNTMNEDESLLAMLPNSVLSVASNPSDGASFTGMHSYTTTIENESLLAMLPNTNSFFSFVSTPSDRAFLRKSDGVYYINIEVVDEDGDSTGEVKFSKAVGSAESALSSDSGLGGNASCFGTVEQGGYIYIQIGTESGARQINVYRSEDIRSADGGVPAPVAICENANGLISANGKVYFFDHSGSGELYQFGDDEGNNAAAPHTSLDDLGMSHSVGEDGYREYRYNGGSDASVYSIKKDSEGYWQWYRNGAPLAEGELCLPSFYARQNDKRTAEIVSMRAKLAEIMQQAEDEKKDALYMEAYHAAKAEGKSIADCHKAGRAAAGIPEPAVSPLSDAEKDAIASFGGDNDYDRSKYDEAKEQAEADAYAKAQAEAEAEAAAKARAEELAKAAAEAAKAAEEAAKKAAEEAAKTPQPTGDIAFAFSGVKSNRDIAYRVIQNDGSYCPSYFDEYFVQKAEDEGRLIYYAPDASGLTPYALTFDLYETPDSSDAHYHGAKRYTVTVYGYIGYETFIYFDGENFHQ